MRKRWTKKKWDKTHQKKVHLKCEKGDLLHGTAEPWCGNAGDHLLPQESAHTQEYAPRPLFNVQRHRRKEETPKLNYENLEKVTIQMSRMTWADVE